MLKLKAVAFTHIGFHRHFTDNPPTKWPKQQLSHQNTTVEDEHTRGTCRTYQYIG